MAFKVGDCVKIKKGVKDAEYGQWDLSGWQGWITEAATKTDPNCLIVWDKITLKNIPNDYIVKGNEDEVEWVSYCTGEDELEAATPRGQFENAEEFAESWAYKHLFNDGTPVGDIIVSVLNGDEDEFDAVDKWKTFLLGKLTFPFFATVAFSENRQLREGQKVSVTGLFEIEMSEADMYGLMVNINADGRKMQHTLSDLESMPDDAKNGVYLDAFSFWFVNK